tara:strand:- start:21754 stop:22452 length:699 start_codon:yes stop_codon:yes gene_type:complete
MGRPSKSLISRERAASAALSVIDTKGLHSLSLELVARRLGVKAPSLYYHFKDKSELLSEVALLLLRDIDPPKIDELDWERTMVRLSKAARRGVLRHPNAAPLILEFFPRRLVLGAYDFWLSFCPYPPEMHMVLIDGLEKLTHGSAMFEAAARSQGVEPMSDFDLDQLPHLAAAVQKNPYDDEELFEETIRAYLRGFQHLPKTTKQLTEAEKRRARRLNIAKSTPAPALSNDT